MNILLAEDHPKVVKVVTAVKETGMNTKKLIGLMLIILAMVSVFGCAQEMVTDRSVLDIKEKGKITVGTDIPYGVMEFYDESGEAVGIDMDLAREIASRIGVEMEVVSMPFDDLFDALKSGTVDILAAAVTITPDRQKEMRFSAPYLDAGMRIGVRESDEEIMSLEDLSNKIVGVLKGTVGEDIALDTEEIGAVVSFKVNEDRLTALQDGTVDAIIVHFLEEVEGVKTIGEPLSVSYYGIVTKIGDGALKDEIDSILRDLKRDGTLGQIISRYKH